ncbi:Folylpolyglutamate synthetase [Arachnomyces sp. PD_36]|nr:Folylpolyglutamate synthetase [Arachnomyces sp. PD_36]
MARNYEDAIKALNSLQSNFAVVEAISKSRKGMNRLAIPEMIEWCQRLGYQPTDLNKLNIIHIAGTKGKGSTSAFISSILSQYLSSNTSSATTGEVAPSKTLNKIGLYTSPHLRFVRERIQINNTPLTEAQFAKYFFETWDRLEASAKANGTDPAKKPVYFRFLTLMAFHTYISEGVDAAIIECGIGGEYDSTNIIVNPVVAGITSLGIDHVAVLGETIEEIAWNKAGIMKTGSGAFTVVQPDAAMGVLRERAEEKKVELKCVEGLYKVEKDNVKLGLEGGFQYTNANLAVAVAGEFLRTVGVDGVPENTPDMALPARFRKGLEDVRLGGRCEIRNEKEVSWHIDGGHTLESIKVAGEWFASQILKSSSSTAVANKRPRALIFNQQARERAGLARSLHETLTAALHAEKPFTHVVFCTNVTYKESGYRPDLVSLKTNSAEVDKLEVQKDLADTWKEIDPGTEVQVKGTIEEAVQFVRELASKENQKSSGAEEAKVMTLVTGSLHLVGGLLEVLEGGK